MTLNSRPDIDQILEAIRKEARARGAKGRVGAFSMDLPPIGLAGFSAFGLPQLELHHVADFLCLPLDVFIVNAYRRVLHREPDAGGSNHYQRALLRGRLTRIEVLGRLAYSPEGRRCSGGLQGLPFAFILATLYHVPAAGPLLAILAKVLRFPAHWQDRSTLESAALISGTWMRR